MSGRREGSDHSTAMVQREWNMTVLPDSPYRIVLADDHVLIRHGIKNLLSQNPGLQVVGEVSNGEELLVLLDSRLADLIILDISMPNIGGLEAVTLVRARYPSLKILISPCTKASSTFIMP